MRLLPLETRAIKHLNSSDGLLHRSVEATRDVKRPTRHLALFLLDDFPQTSARQPAPTDALALARLMLRSRLGAAERRLLLGHV